MRKFLCVIMLAFFFFARLCAQDIAVLKKQTEYIKKDTSAVQLLNRLALAFYNNSENDSCRKYALQALTLVNGLIETAPPNASAELLNHYQRLKATTLETIGNAISYSNTNAAIDTFKRALELRKATGTQTGIGDDYFSIAYLYYVLNERHKSDSIYQLSIIAYEATGDSSGAGTAYNWKAINLRDMGNYGDALENNLHALAIGRKIKDSSILTDAYLAIGFIYMYVNMYDEALQNQQAALEIFTALHDSSGIATVFNDMGATTMRAGRYELALKNHQSALAIRKKYGDYGSISASYNYISDIYDIQGNYKEALANCFEGLRYARLNEDIRYISSAYQSAGNIYLKMKDTTTALKNYYQALEVAKNNNAATHEAEALEMIARIYISQRKTTEAVRLLQRAAAIALPKDFSNLQRIYKSLCTAYEKNKDYKNAFLSHIRYEEYSDSAIGKDKAEKLTNLTNQLAFENKQALLKANNDKLLAVKESELAREKIKRNLGFAGFFIVIVLAIIFFIRFMEKRKLNVALEQSLTNLKATQNQLIQAEKMASLGELTAGVAHEIQNPLNFVNNFSETGIELIEEMDAGLNSGSIEEVKALAAEIKQNLYKINHHGKRADAIVKGMLQHSRKSTGQKEPTDLNALADEYLRLSYHGLRAKDKSFNAAFETQFDAGIGKVDIIPQDFGRVLLNLYNNAFYAVKPPNPLKGEDYKPTITVSTKKIDNKVEIRVADNGSGIPQNIIDKIFQPFFTTKPTGEGTGLGLSLSYDIIKAHGGEIKVSSKEGEGTVFIIALPYSKNQ